MSDIDRRFARFRRTGDAAALARLFDAAAPELLEVALYLSGDRHGAEDLVQGTFLVVIEDAASHEPERPVMPWLLGILANRARELRKARARSPDPLRVAERTAGLAPDDPADAAARAEFAAAVTRALAAMPTPYGEVLTLHLEHGLSAKDIAAALRRPEGTVRTQVVRGMDLLRAALPAGFAAGVFVTLAPGRGLGAVREVVLAKVAGKQVAAGAMAAAGIVGGTLLMKKLLLAGGVMLLAGSAWLAWSGHAREIGGRSPGEGPAPAISASAPTGNPGGAAARDAGKSARPERQAVVNAPTAATGDLHLDVRWQEDDTPAVNVHVWYRTRAGGQRRDESGSTRSDDYGVATFAMLAPGEYRVRACETSEEVFRVAGGETTRATLRIQPDVAFAGVVVDPTGAPVAGAAVRSMTTTDLPTLTTSRGDGSFAWRGSVVHEIWAQKDGRAPSRSLVVKPYAGTPNALRLVVGGEAPLFTGIVLDARGAAAAEALVAISVDESSVRSRLPDGEIARPVPPVVVRADRDGRFATRSVPAGEHWVAASARGCGPVMRKVKVADAATEPVVIRLVEGATVRGTVRDLDGRPLLATVNAWSGSGSSAPGLWPLGHRVIDAHATTQTGEDGRFVLPHLLPATLQLYCQAQGMAAVSQIVDLGEERDLEWHPVPAPVAEIAGRVVDADDRPLAGWQVKGHHGPGRVLAETDAEGCFTLTGLARGSYSVWAVPKDAAGAAASVHWGRARGVQSGTRDLVLRTGWRADAAAFLVGRVIGSDGGRATPARIKLYPKEGHGWDHDHETVVRDAEGRFRIGPLPAGDYQIDVSGAGHGGLRLRKRIDAGQTLDLGAVRLDAHGTVTVAVHRPEGCKEEDLVLRLGDERRFVDRTFALNDGGVWRSQGWAPGPARLEVWGPGVARVEQTVEVQAGADTRVEVTLEGASGVRFVFEQPAPRRPSWTDHMKLTLRDAQGVETPHAFQLDGGETFAWTRGLARGRYTFTAALWDAEECRTEGSFVVPGDTGEGARAPLEVRVAFPNRKPVPVPSGSGPTRR